ncbi:MULTISPECIES: flagellar basal body-associated FliL family protein [Nocardioides]|uniref:Flagellar protein FliL n=1 Tax=Nocardioides lianchengensis TaxID=1045774 RepID=A0A1G6U111_9ACTN|nr:flagellar basal body-associated FliL family protein [Nocardioides lianchengensis]NYG11569.1 flagellar FliL protein [Nocardioides lianchengensis]SDD34981.1 flagellar FliL protein [Nocardioides lianchengensis]
MSVATMPPSTEGGAAAPEKKSKKKLIIAVVLVLVIAGAAYWFFLKPKGPEPAPEPGDVVALEPVQVNLAEGHYLRLSLALQATTTVAHEVEGSKALDLAIETFTGQKVGALANKENLALLKEELLKEIEHAYHGDVMDVYYTEFVTQ